MNSRIYICKKKTKISNQNKARPESQTKNQTLDAHTILQRNLTIVDWDTQNCKKRNSSIKFYSRLACKQRHMFFLSGSK